MPILASLHVTAAKRCPATHYWAGAYRSSSPVDRSQVCSSPKRRRPQVRSGLPESADFVAEVGDDGSGNWRDLLLSSAGQSDLQEGMAWHHSRRTPHSLCKARLCDRRRSDDELSEPAEVLRNCG